MWQKIKNKYHLLIAVIANIIYFFPGKKIKVIGITGTDGKTTTVNLIYHILKTAGFKTSMVSSLGAIINGKNHDIGFHVTTPSSLLLQKLLRKAVDGACEYFVLEVTSHALDQNRVYGIPFELGILTNVTNEHLDYHKTYRNYLKTKVKLLTNSRICLVNKDDKSFSFLPEKNNKKYITYGLSKASDYNPQNFDIKNLNLVGEFNQYNVLAAVSACKTLGLKDEIIKKALKTFYPPIGRVDFVYEKDFKVMIDFAHTPNSFEKILTFIRPTVKGRLIHVFGSAGERDAIKRPILGEISSKYSDVIVLTAEDPRKENIENIIAEIKRGIKNNKCEVIEIADRKKAIEEAIRIAKKGDLVLITGKAQEASINYGKGEEPWNEFEITKQALKKRNEQ